MWATCCSANPRAFVCTAVLVLALQLVLGEASGIPDDLLEEIRCAGPWRDLQRRLFLASSSAKGQAALAAARIAHDAEVGDISSEECFLGQISLRLARSIDLEGRAVALEETVENLGPDWHTMQVLGWATVVRSGWPVFQLLSLLHGHVKAAVVGDGETFGANSGLQWAEACAQMDENQPYAALLERYLASRAPFGEVSLPATSLAYLAASGKEDCPLTVAAAFVAIAWSRLPVYDMESEALLYQSEQHAYRSGLAAMIMLPHPLLTVLARLSEAQQMLFHLVPEESHEISGEAKTSLLTDGEGEEKEEEKAGARTVSRSMKEKSYASGSRGDCVVRIAKTPGGNCNFFAPIDRGLSIWRERGVMLEDVVRAFRPVTDQKTILFRLIDDQLVQVTPSHSHLDVDFGATEPACLANAILAVIAKADLPNFDMVLSHGDLPILRRTAEMPPFYGPMDRDARTPAPLFSICASDDFWDILFPNVCRPSLVNMSGMSRIAWDAKRKVAFWRGTDRGAVNWAKQIRDMYSGSPRKRFLDSWSSSGLFDLAFLEDDLLNSTVVNTDPNFMPLDRWPEWRYLLDLPGNGYSGSLKQKLTGSSAVLLMTDVGVAGATPVYEHYHGGLQDFVHVLHLSMDNAGERVRWARAHDNAMQRLVQNANKYMEMFEELTQCYIWRLLDQYARLLRYEPAHDQTAAFTAAGSSAKVFYVHRRPLRREAKAFKSRCTQLIEDHAK